MSPDPHLATWAAIVAQPVVGRVGHHRTYEAGAAHPTGHAPAWVTARGCNVAKLHRAFCALVVHDRRGEDRECHTEAARVRRRRVAKPKGTVIRLVRKAG